MKKGSGSPNGAREIREPMPSAASESPTSSTGMEARRHGSATKSV
jgi:hypothetical protein